MACANQNHYCPNDSPYSPQDDFRYGYNKTPSCLVCCTTGVSDRPAHKAICSQIKKHEAEMKREEILLKQEKGDDIFETGKGQFWHIEETRPYVVARCQYVMILLFVYMRPAVEAALEHLLDLLQLCRSDEMGMRDMIPSLMLRLEKDQECYDFCKWWATTGRDSNYDFADNSKPYLDTKDADVYESVGPFVKNWGALSQNAAMTLLKLRMLMDYKSLQNARDAHAETHVAIISPIIGVDPFSLNDLDLKPRIRELEKQINELRKTVGKATKRLERTGNLPAPHNRDPHVTESVMRYVQEAWMETPGAFQAYQQAYAGR